MPSDLTATPTEPHSLTIADAARLIESRRLSPVELTDALIARVEALDPQLHAFLCRRRKRPANRRGRRSATSWRAGIAASCMEYRSG